MPLFPIADPADPRLDPFRHLKATNATRWGRRFIVEGATLLDRLLASRYPVESVLTTARAADGLLDRLPADCAIFAVPDRPIAELVGYRFHRGVLARAIRVDGPTLAEVVAGLGRRGVVVACPTLDKPDNLGAILRSADAFGAAAVLVGGPCPDPLSRRVIRVSAGAAPRLPTVAAVDLAGAVGRLRREAGFVVVAADAHPDATPIDRSARPDRTALVLGGEAFGLPDDWLARADRRVTIPMRAGADSLDVAVAAGILLHRLAGPLT